MAKDVVHVLNTSPETLNNDISKLLVNSEFKQLNPGKKTLIKINANYDRNWPGCNTSKWFLDYLLGNLRENGFDDLTVIEGDLKFQPAERTIEITGVGKILEKHNVPFLPIENLPRDGELPIILNESQLISTPVLHTHTFAVISVATKNLYGILPIYREKYHKTLSEKLIELHKKIKVFTSVDGTVGLHGGSMRMGHPLKTDLLLAGWNTIAIDVISSRIMGFPIENVPYLERAKDLGLISDITISGDFSQVNLPIFRFSYNKSKLSQIDLLIRRNFEFLFDYNSTLDRIANINRRIYTSAFYYKNYRKICKGSWIEYERYWLSSGL